MSQPDFRTIAALCVVEDALHHCQYTGRLPPPAWGLRLALAWLYEVAGDDPGIAPKSRGPFDELWRLVTGERELTGRASACGPSTFARTEYASIRRMIGFPQSLANEAKIRELRGRA